MMAAFLACSDDLTGPDDDDQSPPPPPPPAEELSAPSSLVVAVATEDSIVLRWNDNSKNEKAFEIKRRVGAGGTFVRIGETGLDATRFADKDVVPGMTYTYLVRARRDTMYSDYSNEASVTTPLPPEPTVVFKVDGADTAWIAYGETVERSWSVTGKDVTCVASGDSEDWQREVDCFGGPEISASLEGPATYADTLTVTDRFGRSVADAAWIIVAAYDPCLDPDAAEVEVTVTWVAADSVPLGSYVAVHGFRCAEVVDSVVNGERFIPEDEQIANPPDRLTFSKTYRVKVNAGGSKPIYLGLAFFRNGSFHDGWKIPAVKGVGNENDVLLTQQAPPIRSSYPVDDPGEYDGPNILYELWIDKNGVATSEEP